MDVAVLSFGIILAAIGLQGLLPLSEKNEKFGSRSGEVYGKRMNHKRRVGSEREGVNLAFDGTL